MGLRHINIRGFQIETVIFGGKVIGFKVHRRAFFGEIGGWRNYEELGDFPYFTDAARFAAKQVSHGDEKKDQLLAHFLTEIYAEGDDFKG